MNGDQLDFGFSLPEPPAGTGADSATNAARTVEATAYGEPRPQGSMTAQKIRGGARAGQLAVFHGNADKLIPWRDSVIWALRQAHTGDPMLGPVAVRIVFTLRRPQRLPKRKHVWPWRKPDIDKLLRGVLDAATYAGVWKDDAQVVVAVATKHYTDDGYEHVLKTPGAHIRIWEIS